MGFPIAFGAMGSPGFGIRTASVRTVASAVFQSNAQSGVAAVIFRIELALINTRGIWNLWSKHAGIGDLSPKHAKTGGNLGIFHQKVPKSGILCKNSQESGKIVRKVESLSFFDRPYDVIRRFEFVKYCFT